MTDSLNVPVSVVIPGPWWTELTYEGTAACCAGMRAWVPLGHGKRMGLIVSVGEASNGNFNGKLKPLLALMDVGSALSAGTPELLRWFGDTWFCGMGMAMKTLLPQPFLDGDFLPPSPPPSNLQPISEDLFIYDVRDSARMERYTQLLEDLSEGTLLLFPQHDSARCFWDSLPRDIRSSGLLWPKSTAKKAWDAWCSVQKGDVSFVVGAQSAAMAPLPSLRRIIMEDESSHAWKSVRPPLFHMRTLLAKRARLAGAQLVLGGRMPSSRVFMGGDLGNEGGRGVPDKRLIYVDLWRAKQSSADGMAHSLPVSDALRRETRSALDAGRWAFWILDRKGYAGEMACEECGASIRCAQCSTPMRWEGNQGLLCLMCGHRAAVPDKCPFCGGVLLQGIKPGLSSLLKSAEATVKRGNAVLALSDEVGSSRSIARRLMKEHPRGALVLGTRALLALCDPLQVGMIGWIDADFESRAAEYDARVRAFGMLWESCWRGVEPDARCVVVQSRRPGKGWQMGLTAGWRFFWEKELQERQEMDLPPVTPLIRLELPEMMMAELLPHLEEHRFQLWSPEEGTLWLRTRRLGALREVFAPVFDIQNRRKTFPKISIWFD